MNMKSVTNTEKNHDEHEILLQIQTNMMNIGVNNTETTMMNMFEHLLRETQQI